MLTALSIWELSQTGPVCNWIVSHNVLRAHPWCNMCQNFLPWGWVAFCFMCHTFCSLAHSSLALSCLRVKTCKRCEQCCYKYIFETPLSPQSWVIIMNAQEPLYSFPQHLCYSPSCVKYTRFPVSLHPCQHLLFSVLCYVFLFVII